MDPNNGEGPPKGQKQNNNDAKNLPQDPSRRRFIIGGAKGFTIAAAAGLGGGQFLADKLGVHAESSDNQTQDVLVSPISSNGGQNQTNQPEAEVSVEIKQYPPVFEEMFPNCEVEEEKAIKEAIEKYQVPTHEGGIGTLEEIPQMAELLKSENNEGVSFEHYLVHKSDEYGLNPNVVKGLIFIESHGDPNAFNSGTGATGIGQFLVEAGMRYGLVEFDENGEFSKDLRTDPFASVEATCKYLKDLKTIFGGDTGIAVWGYHAGEGNVIGAIREFIKEAEGEDIGDYNEALNSQNDSIQWEILSSIHNYVSENKLNVRRLLWSDAGRKFVSDMNLGDDTENYPIKAAAAGEYFEESPMGASLAQAQ